MSPSSASSNWPSSLSVPLPDEKHDDARDEGSTSGDDDDWAGAKSSACNRSKSDISFRGESRKSRVNGEIVGVRSTDGCLGVVSI